MTNYERIKSMSIEEMACTLMCPNEMGMAEIECDHSDSKNCCQCCLEWLKKEECDDMSGIGKPPKGGSGENKQCRHNYVHMETIRRRGERASFGISPQVSWKRIDRYYCTKCLSIQEIIKEAPGYENKPNWFD